MIKAELQSINFLNQSYQHKVSQAYTKAQGNENKRGQRSNSLHLTKEKINVKRPNRFQYPPIVDTKNTTNRERKKKLCLEFQQHNLSWAT